MIYLFPSAYLLRTKGINEFKQFCNCRCATMATIQDSMIWKKRNKSVILQTETRTMVNIMNELVNIKKKHFNSPKKSVKCQADKLK